MTWLWLSLVGVGVVAGMRWLKRHGPTDPDPWHDPEGEGD